MTDTQASISREQQAELVALAECPPGPFLFEGSLGFKTEYGMTLPDENGAEMPGSQVRWVVTHRPDAYVMASGECFWGGAKNHDERAALLVQPIDGDALDAFASAPRPVSEDRREAIALREALEEIAGAYDAWDPDARFASTALSMVSTRAKSALAKADAILAALSASDPSDAVLAEREACAKVADAANDGLTTTHAKIAAAIRARTTENPRA